MQDEIHVINAGLLDMIFSKENRNKQDVKLSLITSTKFNPFMM